MTDFSISIYTPDGAATPPVTFKMASEGTAADLCGEIVRRWNAYEAMGEALRVAMIDAQSRLHMMPVNADETDKAILLAQIMNYRSAIAAYLPTDQRQDMRGQNIDTQA